MTKIAWKHSKQVLGLVAAGAFVYTAHSTLNLVITPRLIGKLEQASPLKELLALLGILGGILLILEALGAYIAENTLFGRVAVRSQIVRMIGDKIASTSFSNTLDTAFLDRLSKAQMSRAEIRRRPRPSGRRCRPICKMCWDLSCIWRCFPT